MGKRQEKLALVMSGMTLFGVIVAPIVTNITAPDPPKEERPCITVYSDYRKEIGANPNARGGIVEDVLASDPEAERCNIKPSDFPAPP